MYLLFLVFFVFVSVSLIFLILLQSTQGLNNTIYSNIKNNDTSFRYIKKTSFIINIIRLFAGLFLIISIILCNINNRKIDPNFFLKNDLKENSFPKDNSDKNIKY